MFPLLDEFDQNVNQILAGNKAKKVEDMEGNLPYLLPLHIRDNQWLAQYVDICYHYLSTNFFSRKIKVNEIPFNVIQEYVAVAPKFEQYRNLYEKQILKGCISFCQNNADEATYSDSVMYDDFFRSKIIYTAMKLGIDRNTVVEYLEVNAHLWRRNAMYRTFVNQVKYQNSEYVDDDKREFLYEHDPLTWEHFVSKELKYTSLWLRQHERDYENNHAASIKQAGLTPSINLDVYESRLLDLEVAHAKKEYQDVSSVVNEEIKDIEQYGFGLNK